MKKMYLATIFATVISGAAFAGGSAIDDLKSNAPLYALESVSLETPNAASSGLINPGIGTKGLSSPAYLAGSNSVDGRSKAASEANSDSLRKLAKLQSETGVQGSTPYEVLKNLFDKGAPAIEKDLTGWYSGRAVYVDKPDTFRPNLLVGRRMAANPGGGPLFQDKMEFLVNSVGYFMDYPDYYDDMTLSLSSDVNSEIDRNTGWVLSFPAAEGVLSTAAGAGTNVVQYRKTGGYIFEHWADYYEGEIFHEGYAYFFLNVTPAS